MISELLEEMRKTDYANLCCVIDTTLYIPSPDSAIPTGGICRTLRIIAECRAGHTAGVIGENLLWSLSESLDVQGVGSYLSAFLFAVDEDLFRIGLILLWLGGREHSDESIGSSRENECT